MTAADQLESYSKTGLLKRYARGRLAHFWNRQFMTLLGALVLGVVNGPVSGLAAGAIALLGEAVDCRMLASVPQRLGRGEAVRRIARLSVGTAAFQAGTILICVALSWFGTDSHQAPMFALAFLMGAAVNAGLTMPYHPAAARMRLALYGLAAAGLFLHDAIWRGEASKLGFMNLAGALIMAYLVFTFLNYMLASFRRRRVHTLDLLRQRRVLAKTNKELQVQQKEARRLALVAENANDSVILADPGGYILWVNDAFCQSTGYCAQEVVGWHPRDFLNGPETSPETVAEIAGAIAARRPFRGEIENITKSGARIWFDVNLVPVLDEAGETELVLAIERDITEARRYAQDMKAARLDAEQGARSKAEFLATMSHEIRTPMNGVIGMTELLSETELNAEQEELIGTIRSSADALLTIINDVLDLSKLEAGKMALSPVAFDLRACLGDVIRLFQPQAERKGLTLCLDTDAGLPAQILADDGRVRQILLNLVGNALKFTETGGVRVRARAEDHEDGLRLTIAVEDTGIGIDADKLSGIFDSFSQAESATTRRFGGTGLGLTISRRLAEAMDGTLTATSEPGAGSRFVVTLRAERTEPAAAVEPIASASRAAETDLSCVRVLVAEDNRVNRVLMDRYLSRALGYVSFAQNGREAVMINARDRPDLILMDMSMPVLSGLDATREIRAGTGPQPRIVALTANAFDADRAACLAAGMDGFLTKPVRKAELLACIAQQINTGCG